MQLSNFEALGLIPDKDWVYVYYRRGATESEYPLGQKRISFELLTRLTDGITQARFVMVKGAADVGPLIHFIRPDASFYLKPDMKKVKRFEKLNGFELDFERIKKLAT